MFENLLMNNPDMDIEQTETTVVVAQEIREAPQEPDKLAKEWSRRVESPKYRDSLESRSIFFLLFSKRIRNVRLRQHKVLLASAT